MIDAPRWMQQTYWEAAMAAFSLKRALRRSNAIHMPATKNGLSS
jgi:hypothetical protein